jgi:hypothetical protein
VLDEEVGMIGFKSPVFGRVRRGARIAVTAGLMALLAAGCIRVEEKITFDAQGGGTYDVTMGVDRDFVDALNDLGSSANGSSGSSNTGNSGNSGNTGSGSDSKPFAMSDADRAQLVAKYGPGTIAEPYTVEEDGTTYDGTHVRVPFTSVDRFNAVKADMASSGSAPSSSSAADTMKVTLRGDTYTLTGTLPSFADDSSTGSNAKMMAKLLEDAVYYVKITVPGQVTETNADYREGRTYVWEQDGTDEARPIKHSWKPTGSAAASVEP